MCLASQTTVLVLIKQFVILKQTTNISKFTVEVSLGVCLKCILV